MNNESKPKNDLFHEALKLDAMQTLRRRVFVIMPFSSVNSRDQDDLDSFYSECLKASLESVGDSAFKLEVHRSANKLRITEEIVQDLESAEYVVADLSGSPPNPNVMYELGVRFSVSKAPVILIREKHELNRPIFDVSTLHTFHYDARHTAPLIEYLTDKIRAYETAAERYFSPILQSLGTGEPISKAATRTSALRRLDLLERELGSYVEIYGNVASKALESAGSSSSELLQAIDDVESTGARSERFAKTIERQIGEALTAPKSCVMSALEIDCSLAGLLPSKIRDQVVECIQTFQVRFFGSPVQWAMDGGLAASVQFVRAAILLSAVITSTRRLLELDFAGPVDLDEDRRGWVMVDHLQFLSEYGEYLNDLNTFRSRLLRWSGAAAPARPKGRRP